MTDKADLGLIGLAVMGQNLVLNICLLYTSDAADELRSV